MIATVALIAVQVVAASPSMVVSPEQFSTALTICRDQIAKPAFTDTELSSAGWPKAMSSGSDGGGYRMTAYRHPDNMILVTFVVDPPKPAECTVMAPLGPMLSPDDAKKSADALLGKSRNGAWRISGATVTQATMPVGVRFTFIKKVP